jgi:hypothetical protein
VNEALASRDSALEAVGEQLTEARGGIAARDAELRARAEAIAAHEARIADLELVATRLAERVVERERAIRRLRADLAELRDREQQSYGSLTLLTQEIEAVRRQARAQATRMRLRALRDAAEVGDRMTELAQQPGRVGDRLMDSLQEAIRRLGGEGEADAAEDDALGIAAMNGHRDREAEELFDGVVEIEIGPLGDFSKLVGFEDAANAIGATTEISVKRFSEGRATLEMRLGEPVELLRELEERAPFEFTVRDQRGGHLTLDVDE